MIPEAKRPFTVGKDLSNLRIVVDSSGNKDLQVLLQQEGFWVHFPNYQTTTAIWKKIRNGDWEYIDEEVEG